VGGAFPLSFHADAQPGRSGPPHLRMCALAPRTTPPPRFLPRAPSTISDAFFLLRLLPLTAKGASRLSFPSGLVPRDFCDGFSAPRRDLFFLLLLRCGFLFFFLAPQLRSLPVARPYGPFFQWRFSSCCAISCLPLPVPAQALAHVFFVAFSACGSSSPRLFDLLCLARTK